MDTARYVVGLLLLTSLPPALLLWFFIHPLAAFWRKLGPLWTYTILGLPMVGLMVWIFRFRRALLSIDYGTSWLLVGLSLLGFVAGSIIALKRKKWLSLAVLAGIPELRQARYPGRLLTEGIYAKIRHPRYVEVFLFVTSYALFANHLATYVLLLLSVPALYAIVALEERELHERFGEEYERYRQQVPRFVPKRG